MTANQLNEQFTVPETSILDEFTPPEPKREKNYYALTAVCALYVCFLLVDTFIGLDKYSAKRVEVPGLIFILGLPFLGFVFHLGGLKAGWIINCFYYLFVSSFCFYVFLHKYLHNNFQAMADWRGIWVSCITLIATVLLFLAPIRKYFRISTGLFVFMIAASVGLASLIASTSLFVR